MTSEGFIQSLQKIYGSDWYIRLNPKGIPAATRLDGITDAEASQGLAMTLYEADGHDPLADQLAHQTKLKYGL